MIKNYFLLALLLLSFQLFSQEIYLIMGKNYTKYHFKNTQLQSDPNLQVGVGNFYEIGIVKPFIIQHVFYTVGLSINDYNATEGDAANSYRWDTQFLGLNGKLGYSVFPKNKQIDLLLNLGINGSTIIYGKQEANGAYYNLINHKEFSGLWLGSTMGFQVKYQLKSMGSLSLGYDFCQNLNISNTTKEKLSLSTQHIQLGLYFPID